MKSLTLSHLSVAVGAACLLLASCSSDSPGDSDSTTPVYTIEGQVIQLEDGIFEGEVGMISLLASTSGDLDGDALDDQAVILVHNSRGTGVFYYLNVLLDDGNGRLSLAGEAFLGDRIRFDFMDIYGTGSVSRLTGIPIHADDYGQLVVGFHIHGRDQAYAEDPDVYLTRHWNIDDGELVPVEAY